MTCLCISIWATHSVSAVINYTRYIYRRSCCWRLQQQQMPPFIWTIPGRTPASQKITRLACRKIQYVALFQMLCWKWVSEYTGITFHPLPSQMAPNLKWQTASREPGEMPGLRSNAVGGSLYPPLRITIAKIQANLGGERLHSKNFFLMDSRK